MTPAHISTFSDRCRLTSKIRIGGVITHTSLYAIHTPTHTQVKYLNKMLYRYLKYDLPLWLTEFACADDTDLMNEGQETYLADAMTLLELHPSVARYAW